MRSDTSIATAAGLKDQGEDIAGNEDTRVRERLNARVLRAKGSDDT